MISLLVTLEVHPDHVDDFIAYISEEAAGVRAHEPGCHRFEVSRSVEKPNVFGISETYDDLKALETHRTMPHYLLFRQRTIDGMILSRALLCGEVLPL
jgi:(4S)-4-hydroxy-5-phosphonooxypentane-2,3-dione isomerase